ncbi:hypothetical protein EIK77_001200 [Talaromyces pinophilus]|nr:hypothetical protein EIK77_001200 [Talaromyces pinophilus]
MGEPETPGPPRRDEGKPRCRNCIDKGFQCQYGSQLTFLTKNAITVSAPEAPQAYSTIKFVSEDPQSILNESSSWEDEEPLTPTDAPVSRPVSVPPPAIGAITTILQQGEPVSHDDPSFAHWADCEIDNPGLDLDPRLSFYSPQDQPTNPAYHHHEDHLRQDTFPVLAREGRSDPEVISPVVVSDKDAFAARGLLALISSEDVTPALGSRPGIGFHHDRTASDYTPLTRIDDNRYANATNTQPAATQRTTELLRHYRYEVAPWVGSSFHHLSILLFDIFTNVKQLDLCDMYQSFGIAAFQYAMDSEQILRALLLLSEASLRNKNLDRRSSAEQFRSSSSLDPSFLEIDYDDSGDGEHSLMTTALTTIFRRVHAFISNLSRAWSTNNVLLDMALVSSLVMDAATSKPTSAIYWLFLRLGMSQSS